MWFRVPNIETSNWRAYIRSAWKYFSDQAATVVLDPQQCHHTLEIEPNISFDLREIKKIAQAAVYFDRPFAQMSCGDLVSRGPQFFSSEECVAILEKESKYENIVELSRRLNLGLVPRKDHEYRRWFTIYAFDHAGLASFPDFHRPSVQNGDELVQWVGLVQSFVEASLSCSDLPNLLKHPANLMGLGQFLHGRGRGSELVRTIGKSTNRWQTHFLHPFDPPGLPRYVEIEGQVKTYSLPAVLW